ncbi:uncharacterized protein [Setaria viridis]|uniref:uncharacterized protein n=1 Tax=Setaria viridis TaxID=4556 RepID=UPI00149329B0|nr:uncharacterized protein LOC117854216 [Setaria viridis]
MSTLSTSTSSSNGPQPPGAMGESVGPIFVNPYATVAVKSHIPMTLELKNSNFSKWSSFFRAMCGKFGLLAHVNGTAPPRCTDPAWEQADCCIRSWLFGSILDAVLDLAMDGIDQMARQLWVAIDNLFQANKASRAIFLSHEFHSMTQGDLSIDDNCHRMKTTIDALRNIGQPVSEPTLVLNLLRGLTKPYSTTTDNIAANSDLTFTAARNQLLLKELHLKNAENVTAASALVASFAPSCGHSSYRSSSSQGVGQQQQQRNDGQRHNKPYGGGGYSTNGGTGGGG